MIIRRQSTRDGIRYSITDMTRDDLDNLAFGACTAVVFHNNNGRTESPEWNTKRANIMTRLERQIRRVLPRHDGVTPDRRVEVTSDGWVPDDEAFTIYQEVSAR